MSETKLFRIRYKRLDDLVKFVSMTPQPFLNHAQQGGQHIYFFMLPFSGGLAVYYFASDQRVEGEFISLNRMSGKFSPASKPSFDAQSVDFPILEVDSTNVLDDMPL